MEIPRHWRLKAQRYRLEGSNCLVCGTFTFPSRPVCPRCTALSTSIESIEIYAPFKHQITDEKFLAVGMNVSITS